MCTEIKTKRFQRNTYKKFMNDKMQTFLNEVEKVQKSKNDQLKIKIKCAIKRKSEISE